MAKTFEHSSNSDATRQTSNKFGSALAAPSFSLSANIENGFADGMQYLVTPNAQNAIHNIVNDFRTGIHSFTIIGSYGTGKSSFLLALEADLKKTGKQKYLLDSKNLSDAKSFEIMNIVGDYAEMSTLLSKALNVEGNTTSILDSLKNYYTQCQKKGKFLLIVVDEFKPAEHLTYNLQHPVPSLISRTGVVEDADRKGLQKTVFCMQDSCKFQQGIQLSGVFCS